MDIHKGLTIPKLFFAIAFVTQVCLLKGQAAFPEIPDATGQAMATFPPPSCHSPLHLPTILGRAGH